VSGPRVRAGADAADRRGRPPGAVPAAALAIGGWALLVVALPLAIFLTWFGDCFEETCAAASEAERLVYLFDFGAWLVLPALAFGAYRGWRPASLALVGVGLALAGQVVAAILGARGFQAFAIVLPAAGLIAGAGVIGLAPSLIGGDEAATARTGLVGLVIVAAVVVAIAFQAVTAGALGVGDGILGLVGASLAFVAVLAFVNRGGGRGSASRPPATRRPQRRRR
jgi:hypothetical protein